jgi:hypothetical protein
MVLLVMAVPRISKGAAECGGADALPRGRIGAIGRKWSQLRDRKATDRGKRESFRAKPTAWAPLPLRQHADPVLTHEVSRCNMPRKKAKQRFVNGQKFEWRSDRQNRTASNGLARPSPRDNARFMKHFLNRHAQSA